MDDAWYIPIPGRAAYSDAQARSGQRSMRIGIVSGTNYYSYATVRQVVTVPVSAENPTLAFWYYPISGDTVNDLQYVLLQDDSGNSAWALRARSDAQAWIYQEYVIPAAYRGKPVTLYFGVLNDGTGGITAMYVDDVSLSACAAQPTPTRTATAPPASPTATPGTQPTPSVRVPLPLLLRSFSAGEEVLPVDTVAPEVAEPQSEPVAAARVAQPELRTLWAPTAAERAPDPGQGMALDPTSDRLYVAAGNAIRVLSARTGRLQAQVALPAAPRGLAVHPAMGRVFAALWEADAVAVLDVTDHTLLWLVPGIPGASGVAVGRDRVYVTATRSNELVVLDVQTCAIIQRVPVGDAPYAVVSDPVRQRVYVTNAGEDTVSIVDSGILANDAGRSTEGAIVGTVRLGGLGHPQNLALDSVRGRVYVTYALTPKYRGIAVIDGLTGQIVSHLAGNAEETLFGAYGIAVDGLMGRLYVPTVRELLVLSAESMEIIARVPGMGPVYGFGLTMDAEDQLYLVDGWHKRLTVVGR